jgi:hypothetical protein
MIVWEPAMELDLDSWKERVANPEALGDREKTLWKKMEPVLNEVLNEMKTNGKIETVYIKAERDRLIGPLKILEETSVAHNNLIHVFEMAEQDRSLFFETMRRFAFDEASVVGMYLTLTGALTVLCTELFKLFLLFHMKDVNHNVSRFSYTMRTVAPRSWP